MKDISRIHPVLGSLIENLEKDYKVIITDGARSIQEHVEIYKKNYPKNWHEKIPFGSRHLPSWDTIYLRAIDIKLYHKDREMTGDEIKLAVEAVKDKSIFFGYGIGKNYLHVDCDRKRPTEWRYEKKWVP